MAVFTDEGKTYHVRVGKGDIGRYVLLPGDPFRTDLIASYFCLLYTSPSPRDRG